MRLQKVVTSFALVILNQGGNFRPRQATPTASTISVSDGQAGEESEGKFSTPQASKPGTPRGASPTSISIEQASEEADTESFVPASKRRNPTGLHPISPLRGNTNKERHDKDFMPGATSHRRKRAPNRRSEVGLQKSDTEMDESPFSSDDFILPRRHFSTYSPPRPSRQDRNIPPNLYPPDSPGTVPPFMSGAIPRPYYGYGYYPEPGLGSPPWEYQKHALCNL